MSGFSALLRLSMQGRLWCPFLEKVMDTKLTRSRLARLQAECEVSAAPPILLAAACLALFGVLGLNTWMAPISVSQADRPTEQTIAHAEENAVRNARRQVGSGRAPRPPSAQSVGPLTSDVDHLWVYCGTSTAQSLLKRAGWQPLETVVMQDKPLTRVPGSTCGLA